MARFIIKIQDETTDKDYYMEWSTVVDAPVTEGMELKKFKKYYKSEYGEEGMRGLPERLKRVEKNGCSGHYPYDKVEDFFKCNRAGEDETCITKEEIFKLYCLSNLESF